MRAKKDLEQIALERQAIEAGVFGMEVISDTTLHNGSWGRIVIIADATFSTLESGIDATFPKQFLAGNTLDGNFTAIQMTGGEIQAYKKESD